MKRKRKILLTAAIVAVAALSWFAVSFYVHYMNTIVRSSVKAPVRFALQEISDDMNNGQYDTAKEKLDILMRDWDDYFLYNGVTGHAFSGILREFHDLAEQKKQGGGLEMANPPLAPDDMKLRQDMQDRIRCLSPAQLKQLREFMDTL